MYIAYICRSEHAFRSLLKTSCSEGLSVIYFFVVYKYTYTEALYLD